MKKINKKLIALHDRISKLQDWLYEYRDEVEENRDELEGDPHRKKQYKKLGETLEYIDDVWYALDAATGAIENYIEE